MSEWAPGAKIIHIDVDPAEISKNRAAHIGIAGQAGPTLAALAEAYRALPEPHDAGRRAAWVERIAAWKRQHPYHVDEGADTIQPQQVIQAIYRATRGGAIICTDVGQHQMWAAQHYPFDRPRRWITSGGLGTMGFGLPAALGAQVAMPDELVIDIAGDGSFEMTLQELSTAQMYGLPVKVVILNNGYLGMVRQWQELFWEGRYAGTSFEPFQPSFAGIARAYGIAASTVHDRRRPRGRAGRGLRRPRGRRWLTCTSTRWPRSSPWSPRARGPARSSSAARPPGRAPSRTRRCARRSGSPRRRSPSPPRG